LNLSLEKLLEENRFQWVKNDLFYIFSLLEFKIDVGDGYFTLPLSKENIIFNLQRITGKSRETIIEDLDIFNNEFNEYIEIPEPEVYKYYQAAKPYDHPPSPGRKPCPEPENATLYYVLKSEIKEFSKRTLDKEVYDFEIFFNTIISQTNTIQDLLYLFLLKKICRKSIGKSYYSYERYDHTFQSSMNNGEDDLNY